MSYKKFKRSSDNKILGGVCGGLGEYFDVDPIIFRIIFIILGCTGGGILIYFIIWICTPKEITYSQNPPNTNFQADEKKPDYNKVDSSDAEFSETQQTNSQKKSQNNSLNALIWGLILIFMGFVFLLQKVCHIFVFREWWPLFLVVAGALLLIISISNKSKN